MKLGYLVENWVWIHSSIYFELTLCSQYYVINAIFVQNVCLKVYKRSVLMNCVKDNA